MGMRIEALSPFPREIIPGKKSNQGRKQVSQSRTIMKKENQSPAALLNSLT